MDLKELAREPELSQAAVSAAEEIGDHCIERPYHNYQLTLAAQIIQAALQRAVADAREEWLKFACRAMCMVPQNITDDDGLHEPSCIALRQAFSLEARR